MKKVSVITGTYNRPNELARAIQCVQEQTYSNIEHIIVHDGPPSVDIMNVIVDNQFRYDVLNGGKQIKFFETGRQWSQFLSDSISAVPYQVAQWMSSGDYITWMADDETMESSYIELMVDLLEREDVDFVYPKSLCYFSANLNVMRAANTIGKPIPVCGSITTALFRAELLDYRGFMTHIGSGTDWDQVKHWMEAGASYAFLDTCVLHTHRVDKLGDAGLNHERQKLRGQVNSNKE